MEYRIEGVIEGSRQKTAIVLLRDGGVYRRAECGMPLNKQVDAAIQNNIEQLFAIGEIVPDGAIVWMQLDNGTRSIAIARVWLAMTAQLDAAEYPELAYLVSAGVSVLGENTLLMQRYNKLVNALRQAPQQQQQDFIALLTVLMGNNV